MGQIPNEDGTITPPVAGLPDENAEPKSAEEQLNELRAQMQKLENDREADKGRLRQEQEKLNTAQQYLNQAGWAIDEHGVPVQIGGNPYQGGQYSTQQQQEPVEEDDDIYTNPAEYVDARAARAAMAVQAKTIPIMERLLERSVAAENPDWMEIRPTVAQLLRQQGFSSLTHAESTGTLNLFIAAARGVSSGPVGIGPKAQAPNPETEAQRQEGVQAAASVGTPNTEVIGQSGKLSAAERQMLTEQGIDPNLAQKLLSGPASIGKAGKK